MLACTFLFLIGFLLGYAVGEKPSPEIKTRGNYGFTVKYPIGAKSTTLPPPLTPRGRGIKQWVVVILSINSII